MSVICFHFDLCQSFSYHFELYQLTGPFQIWLSLPSYHHMRTVQIIFRDHSKNCTAWWNSFKIMYMKNAHNFNLVQDETWIWTIPKSTHYCTAWWNSLRRLPKWKTFSILALDRMKLESGPFQNQYIIAQHGEIKIRSNFQHIVK